MIRPKREVLNHKSLDIIGIPKKFRDINIEDIVCSSEQRKNLKDFVISYIDNIHKEFDDGKGIYFYGSNGVGKTMISSIILREAYRNRFSCYRVTFSEYVSIYTDVWSGKGLSEKSMLEQKLYLYKGAEFLVLEEIGKNIDSKICVPILEDLLRYREDKGYVTIISTNITPKDLKTLYGDSIESLIKGNCIPVLIVGKDMRVKK